MHRTQSHCQIIQKKRIYERKNDPKWRRRRLRVGFITKKTINLSKSGQQRCRLQLLVGCRHSIKQILHYKRHVIELLRNRRNPSPIIKQWSFLGPTDSNSNRPWISNYKDIGIHVWQSSYSSNYWWRWALRWVGGEFDSDWWVGVEKSLWGDGWVGGWIWTIIINW